MKQLNNTQPQLEPDNKKIIDPVSSLNFMVSVSSIDPIAFQAWHLDREKPLATEAKPNANIHPKYHISFGGGLITKARRKELGIGENGEKIQFDFGQTLFIGTPRFMHPPMDIILGIDFILSHYVSKDYAEIFLKNTKYQRIVKTMKEALWKPYAFSLANNFCSNWANDTQHFAFDDTFCKSIIGEH